MQIVASRIARRITPLLAQALTSPRTRDLRRWVAERRRRLRSEKHRVHYFHQVDDPYSQLAAQVLGKLVERFDVELVPHVVGPPPDSAAPERARLEAFALRDAADVAPGYGLVFPSGTALPDPSLSARAGSILVRAISAQAFSSVAPRVGGALWSGDSRALDGLAAELGSANEVQVQAAVADGNRLREQLGHYLGAMFLYGGEWYWGVDRLDHLERRLQSLGVRRPGAPADSIAKRPDVHAKASSSSSPRIVLEFYPSLRSPYTCIVMERVYALARRYPVELALRPVLPMVMRGLPVPRAKQLYITLDTKREAEDAGVSFGHVCDPVGRPVERAFSLYPWARSSGRAAELLLSFARAAFAEGIDTGSDAGLRLVVERAGLSWDDAREHLDGDSWQPELENNRLALFSLGLWGVPSFCLRGADGEALYSTWGQDRLWRVEQEIQRLLAPSR